MKKLRARANSKNQQMALDNCVALFVTGSQLYGTNTPESDTDYEGIFIEDPEYVIGTKSCDEVDFGTGSNDTRNTKDDIDCKLYSLRKYFQLAQQNNPNKVEWFFIPEDKFVFKDKKYWDMIVINKHLFLSLKLKHSFSGYAKSQEYKLVTKKKRLDELREFLDILREGVASGARVIGDLVILEEYTVKKYHKETDSLGTHNLKRVKGKHNYIKYKPAQENDSETIEVDNKSYNFGMDVSKILNYVEKEVIKYGSRTKHLEEYGIDLKFASHLFRLYYEGMRLLKTGSLVFPMPENEVRFMMDIKKGKHSLDYLLAKSKELEPLLEKAYSDNKGNLPYSANQTAIHHLQIDIFKKYWLEKGYL